MNHGETPQPKPDDAYTTPGNPAEHKASESKAGAQQSSLNDPGVFSRRAGDEAGIEPKPTALGAGSSHPDTAEDRGGGSADTQYGEQMATYAEGDVMKAQGHKTGTGEEQSFTSDLDRKKEEQQAMRERIQQEKKDSVADGENLQSGGPATMTALQQKGGEVS